VPKLSILLRFSALIALLASAAAICRAQQPAMAKGAGDVVALLEKSGYSYTKVSNGVWEINFTGKNIKEFPVRLALGEGILVIIAKFADRKDVDLQPALLTKLLELNHSIDSVKLALSSDMLYARFDARLRTLDSVELKYSLDQISGATDEVYPQVKQFLGGAK